MNAYSDYLYHEGVKGMHWGVRRYQNADGTLTALGRIHYGVKDFYNGPKMDHVRSSITRGWYTANDPEFLNRKMSDVKASLGRASIIMKDPQFWNQDVKNVRSFVDNYFGAKKIDAHEDTRIIDPISSNAPVGASSGKTKINQNGMTFDYDANISSTYSMLSGNTTISVYNAYQDAKNLKFTDLAQFGITERYVDHDPYHVEKPDTVTRAVETTIVSPSEITLQPGYNTHNVLGGNVTYRGVKNAAVDRTRIDQIQSNRDQRLKGLAEGMDRLRDTKKLANDYVEQHKKEMFDTGHDVGAIEFNNELKAIRKKYPNLSDDELKSYGEAYATKRGNQFVDEFIESTRDIMKLDFVEEQLKNEGKLRQDILDEEMVQLQNANQSVNKLKRDREKYYRAISENANVMRNLYYRD